MTSIAYLRGPRRQDGAASRGTESRRGDREEHETRLPAPQPTTDPALLRCVFSCYSSQCVRRTDRASTETHMHAFTHVHAPSRTHLPLVHTFLILLPLLMANAFCSLLFPFSLSVCSSLPFFNILFLSLGYTCSQLLLTAPTFPPSLSLPPSLHSPPSRAASPSISSPLSLQCVQSERPLSEPQRARTMEWRGVQ